MLELLVALRKEVAATETFSVRSFLSRYRPLPELVFSLNNKRCIAMSAKKKYAKPSVTVHGAVEDITRQGGVVNKDDPEGDPNTAYS